MQPKKRSALSIYKRWLVLGWVCFVGIIGVQIIIGCLYILIFRERPGLILGVAVDLLSLGLFVLSGYYFLKYRNTPCPSCKGARLGVGSFICPFDKKCASCGCRLDQIDKDGNDLSASEFKTN